MKPAHVAQDDATPEKRSRVARDRLDALKARTAPTSAASPDAALIALADECVRQHTAAVERWVGQDFPEDALDHVMELYERLTEAPAVTVAGIAAKARALFTWSPDDLGMGGGPTDLARAIAEEIIALSDRSAGRLETVQEREATHVPFSAEAVPDPILAAIAEGWRLQHVSASAFADFVDSDSRGTVEASERLVAAQNALFTYCRGTLLTIIPTTATGCALLAQFALDIRADQGVPIFEDGDDNAVLELIAQSPMR